MSDHPGVDVPGCPPGTSLYYGGCVPNATASKGGGCQAGGSPEASLVPLFLLFALGFATRRRARS